MKIAFRKVPKTATPFSLNRDEMECSGTFRESGGAVELKMSIKGSFETTCDSCGDEYRQSVDDDLSLRVIDGFYRGDEIDIVEMHGGFMDLDYIFDSEISSYKSDYHYCNKCKEMKE